MLSRTVLSTRGPHTHEYYLWTDQHQSPSTFRKGASTASADGRLGSAFTLRSQQPLMCMCPVDHVTLWRHLQTALQLFFTAPMETYNHFEHISWHLISHRSPLFSLISISLFFSLAIKSRLEIPQPYHHSHIILPILFRHLHFCTLHNLHNPISISFWPCDYLNNIRLTAATLPFFHSICSVVRAKLLLCGILFPRELNR